MRILVPSATCAPTLLGGSPAVQRLLREVELAGHADATVLVVGETGSGKELVARLVHARSARCDEPFVAVNCCGIPETLLESELFGHVRGSFTGAVRDHAGLVRRAEGGTLFLDELGDMSLRMQAVPVALHRVRGSAAGWRLDALTLPRRPYRRCHTSGFGRVGARRILPPGPVLPHERPAGSCASSARTGDRHSAPAAALHEPGLRVVQTEHAHALTRGRRVPRRVRLARQRSTVAERRRTARGGRWWPDRHG